MKTNHLLINAVLLAALLLVSCSSDDVKVGELRTESKSVELGDARSVSVKIKMGAGDLVVTGGAEKLLEADFTYNVAKLKPEVEFTDGTLIVQHPDVRGYRTPQDIKDFRTEWDFRLNNDVPMNLSLDMGAGTSALQLSGLSLTGLDVTLGAGKSTVDLTGNWVRDLDVTFDTGAANITVRLPRDVGVRVEVVAGLSTINAPSLTKNGSVYTNAAYGVSDVTLQIEMQAGIGRIQLEIEEAGALQDVGVTDLTQPDPQSAIITGWVWHDLCASGKDGEPAPATTPAGCVKEESPLGTFHADGTFSKTEPLIEGVVVTLGEGACPSTGLAETPTITSDLSYSFSGLKAGIYCVSIDPQREPNFSILRPGVWTFPTTSQAVIEATVRVAPGEYKGMVNFGWDYQFQP
jgi:hypothetical protein